MILRPRPTTWQLLYLTRGSILPLVAPRLLFVGAVACLASWFAQRHPPAFAQITVAPFTLIGIALSLFLGFRNSACHERWWEGRKQWGALLVHTRALARQTDALLAQAPELRIELLRAAIGFTHALNARLRGGQASAAAAPWLPAEPAAAIAAAPNPTDAVLGWMSRRLGQALHDQQVHPLLYPSLAAPVAGLGEVQAACERIHGTPLPFAYTLLLHRTALLFCTLLPFGLAGTLGWATPLLSMLMAYAMFGLDALGDQLEDPFGRADNDLPLDALTRTVEIELRAALGETALPAPLQPQRFVLT
ncbi:bestrophin family protein [Pseudoxanthomonas winnipegensis]|jgi:putative membrane protein|uniref:Bestrophin n=1 Tax=Pseudoxanthomonas winnipegensis TaxID=2480810 RepID=A0A4V2HCK8_9GAMM|nr:bestrophin family protein [Pseudoxanthomonas winnipegensis]TAA21335.1 bestrophin [Pseudoxanthomonas winnipegensis]